MSHPCRLQQDPRVGCFLAPGLWYETVFQLAVAFNQLFSNIIDVSPVLLSLNRLDRRQAVLIDLRDHEEGHSFELANKKAEAGDQMFFIQGRTDCVKNMVISKLGWLCVPNSQLCKQRIMYLKR